MIRIPSVPNYAGVRKLIEHSTPEWLEEFLARDGLSLLFTSLEKLSSGKSVAGGGGSGGSGGFSAALLQLEVVYAVRAVVNSKVGLEYLLTQRQFTRQLIQGSSFNGVCSIILHFLDGSMCVSSVTAMSTKNALIKKQVVDLLSAVCVYSTAGHGAALDALDYFMMTSQELHRCAILVNELHSPVETGEYKTSVLAFINCLILGTESQRLRYSIRSELIGNSTSHLFLY